MIITENTKMQDIANYVNNLENKNPKFEETSQEIHELVKALSVLNLEREVLLTQIKKNILEDYFKGIHINGDIGFEPIFNCPNYMEEFEIVFKEGIMCTNNKFDIHSNSFWDYFKKRLLQLRTN